MRVINTQGLRTLVTRSELLNKRNIAFALSDVMTIADELDQARLAVKVAGDLIAEGRRLVEELTRTDLLDLERKRVRNEAGEWLPKVAEILGETEAQIKERAATAAIDPPMEADTILPPGSERVQ